MTDIPGKLPDGNKRWDGLPRRAFCEESPDRKGHFTAEIADRGNLMVHVTEKNRMPRHARVKT